MLSIRRSDILFDMLGRESIFDSNGIIFNSMEHRSKDQLRRSISSTFPSNKMYYEVRKSHVRI